MKNKIALIISFFWIGTSFGQVKSVEDYQGLLEFEQYVSSILIEKKEVINSDSIPKNYRIIYSATCYYFEQWDNSSCAFGTSGKSFINELSSDIDTLLTDAMFGIIKRPYICAENPVNYSEVEAIFVLKNGKLFNADTTSSFDIDITPSYGWRYTPKMSYDNGRFLLHETTKVDGKGEGLLPGTTTTFYLERVD